MYIYGDAWSIGWSRIPQGNPDGQLFVDERPGETAVTFNDSIAERIVAFLTKIGIPVVVEPLAVDTLLPAMTVRDGALVIDPARLEWPGDLLHEAGHIAVTDPALRPTLNEVPSDAAEEMAAIAWSYAAAVELGLDASLVFHEAGYRGRGPALAEGFTAGRYVGVPMLDWFGMTIEGRRAARGGLPAYPHMQRWLR
jgi:hypothetical protein